MKRAKDVNSKFNPPAERFHIESMVLAPDGLTPGDASRIYFNHIPQIETGQLVGLISLGAFNLFGNNISGSTTIPIASNTLQAVFGFYGLFVTIVNTKGETLFSQIPYSILYPIAGRIKPYNAVNIDSRKSFFSFAPGAIPSGPLTAQLGFLMQYQ